MLESRLGVLAEIRRLYLQRVLQGVPGRPSSLVSVTRRAGMDGACEPTFKRVRMYMMPAFVLWLQTWEVSKSRQKEDDALFRKSRFLPGSGSLGFHHHEGSNVGGASSARHCITPTPESSS